VNVQRLGKQLKREFRASPKKAALLAVVALVGVYYWTPLIVGWMAPDENMVVAAAADADTPDGAAIDGGATAANQPSAAAQGVQHAWDKLVAWRRSDSRASSARDLPAVRDPFEPIVYNLAATGAAIDEEPESGSHPAAAAGAGAVARQSVTPRAAGLTLTATVLGSRPMAVINGKTVLEGGEVRGALSDAKQHEDAAAAAAVPVTFLLAKVRGDSVALERNGEEFELKLERARLSDGNVIGPLGSRP
jgi:hypothetical protein